MMEGIIYISYSIMTIFFSLMLGVIAGALALCLFYLVWSSCWNIVSLFIPKNYRKGGKFHQK